MIDQYGWSDALRQEFAPFAAQNLEPARVTAQHRGHYVVMAREGPLEARLSGRFAHEAPEGGFPAVGDWVALAPSGGDGGATIHGVAPRRTAFSRRAADSVQAVQVVAANIDVVFLVTSMNGELNPRRLERYLASARQSGARPVVLLTKADLSADVAGILAQARAVAGDAPVLALSALTGEGLEALSPHLAPGETCVLVGSSGVGKSTLVNALAGHERMATGGIRENDAHGRHTTTHRELFLLPSGALLLDTPGMREFGLLDADEGLDATFADIEALSLECKFSDCGHEREPGCAIRRALDSGVLDPGRWQGFQKLKRELAHHERQSDHLAREAERRRWIGISKAQRAQRKRRDDR